MTQSRKPSFAIAVDPTQANTCAGNQPLEASSRNVDKADKLSPLKSIDLGAVVFGHLQQPGPLPGDRA